MARGTVEVAAPASAVWSVLADPFSYGEWVVGSHRVRAADGDWPSPGSAFHHTVGMPPLAIDDRTVVLDADPPRRLRLLARARPLPSAVVTFELRPLSGGAATQVAMIEDIAQPLLNLAAGPLGHGLLRLRVLQTLRRLARVVERQEG